MVLFFSLKTGCFRRETERKMFTQLASRAVIWQTCLAQKSSMSTELSGEEVNTLLYSTDFLYENGHSCSREGTEEFSKTPAEKLQVCRTLLSYFICLVTLRVTLRAESLSIFLDKSGRGK